MCNITATMAKVVLGLGTSHNPLLSVPGELREQYEERDRANNSLYRIPDGKHVGYEERLSEANPETHDKYVARHNANPEGIGKLSRKIGDMDTDVIVKFGDDQSETLDHEQMPAMALFWRGELPDKRREARVENDPTMEGARELYGTEEMRCPVNSKLGKHMMQVRRLHEGQTMSHAFGFVWRRLMTNKVVPTIPIHINTDFPSNQPTPEPYLELDHAVRRAVESWNSGATVAVLA